MQLGILHISDLHRTPDSPVGNGPLVESLVHDVQRYTQLEGIPPPRLIVVSGDIVQGVSGNEPLDRAAHLLDQQYSEAGEFLSALADELLEGDRSRVVIVAGNHDISFPQVRQSTRVLPTPTNADERSALVQTLRSPGSKLRWDWEALQFLEIFDDEAYSRRFEPFARFYEKFYAGKRTFPLVEDDQVTLFEYPEFGLVFVGFNTGYGADPLNQQAAVNPTAVALASRHLRNSVASIRVAVFHHGFGGGPGQPDFVDEDFAQQLLESECTLALHGHVHRTRFFQQRFLLDGRRSLSTVGAGSLCAGPHALPPAEPRSYNVIVLEPAQKRARVHRRMQYNTVYQAPLWGSAPSPAPFATPHEFSIFRCSLALAVSRTKVLDAAFGFARRGDWSAAINMLRPHIEDDEDARRLAVDALQHIDEPTLVLDLLNIPQNLSEAIVFGFALADLGKYAELGELLQGTLLANVADPVIREARAKLELRINQPSRGGSP